MIKALKSLYFNKIYFLVLNVLSIFSVDRAYAVYTLAAFYVHPVVSKILITGLTGALNGIAVDPVGNYIYTAEYSANRISMYFASTGSYFGSIGKSTAAGTCVAGKQNAWCTGGTFSSGTADGMLSGPESVAIDSTNDAMYIADSVNNRIQKFTLSTGAFVGAIGKSIAAGTCVAGKQNTWCVGGTFSSGAGNGMFNNPVGITLDPSTGTLFISEGGNNRIQKFTLSSGAFVGGIGNSTAAGTCVAGKQNTWCVGGTFSSGATDGVFNYPNYITLDAINDALFIADSANNRIQKFILSTGAFVGAIGKSTAAGTCVAGAQTTWCTGGTFGVTSKGSGDGMFSNPNDVKIDVVRNFLYVADSGNKRLQRFLLSTGAFAGAIGNSTAVGTCIAGTQKTWCNGGSFSAGSIAGQFSGVYGLTIDVVNNRLYAGDYTNNSVQVFSWW